MGEILTVAELEVGIPYIVINLPYGSTLRKGDRVVVEDDGAMLCSPAGGWLDASDWRRLSRVRFRVDVDSVRKRVARAKKEHDALLNLL